MSLRETIARIGLGAVESTDPVSVLFGTVTQTEPLEVNLDQRINLPSAVLIVPESLAQPALNRRPLEPGDSVILLRLPGGQRYIVLDRVVSP
ncbi:DUF2577 domain-containing protein [Gorillibacterium sp. sgz5001074]|uniref:DUF2577 domain-containing protein n=1 Tax=Gorillibacterium sp. sgz5001074 TaxID=3446695 RepID=UPI003F663DB4